jgi:hypothetical protein
VPEVIRVVAGMNALLLVIALATAAAGGRASDLAGLALGAAVVTLALRWMVSPCRN